MKFLIYEHVAGGGYANRVIPPSLLSEGYGMLTGLVSDFRAMGHEVSTLLDSRVMKFNPPLEATEVHPISSRTDLKESLQNLSRSVDGVYLTAPESSGILSKLIEAVVEVGGASLNCSIEGIERCSDKMLLYDTLKASGLPVPETVTVNGNESLGTVKRIVKDMGFPLIFKPKDGVGCTGLSFVAENAHIEGAVKKVSKESLGKPFIVQKFVKGTPASVSLISTGDRALPMSLNEQLLTLAPPNLDSSYLGGTVPLHHPVEKKALGIAKELLEALKGLRGYVGFDLVLTGEGPVIVEVNPRLTSSYVGLRKVVDANLSKLLVNSVLEASLPERIKLLGYAVFSKVKIRKPTATALRRTYSMAEVATPPFPVGNSPHSYTLLVTHCPTLKRAKSSLERAKRSLLTIIRKSV